MKSLFRSDNPFWNVFSKLAELLILNFCFIIASIPLFTAGAAFTAASYTAMKLVKGESDAILPDFMRSFRENFTQGTALLAIDAVCLSVLYRILGFFLHMEGGAGLVLYMLFATLFVFFIVWSIYGFFVLAGFKNTVADIYLKSFMLIIRHFPQSMVIAIISICPPVFALTHTELLPYAVIFYSFIGAGAAFMLMAFIFNGIFKKYQ